MTTSTGTSTTYFVGTHYEVTDGLVTKYYYAGTQRIAMRKAGTLNFILGDHLGSTSVIVDANGGLVSKQMYKPWGETRSAAENGVTKYQYTGQYSYVSDFGLHFYNARWLDSSLGRFAQADTIVPGGVQGYDRYVYANNSPLRYTDPSGHCSQSGDNWCFEENTSGSNITSTPTPPIQNNYVGSIMCGRGANMKVPGLGCMGGGTQDTYQMTIWNSEQFRRHGVNLTFRYTPYPGYGDASEANSSNGKALQSIEAYNKTIDAPFLINIGYSSGAESSLFATELRQINGAPPAALIIIEPNYNEDTGNYKIAVDYNGSIVTVDTFVERVANVSVNTPVLIIDDTKKISRAI
jgi:RHS repeat-associated protein